MKIIAHRGASLVAPENTLAAFRKAKQLGAKAIELDVHFSLDEQIVVHHEYALGHPDSGKGLIFETSSQEIQAADAGSWMDAKFKGEKIPLLEDVFRQFGNSFDYELELKATSLSFLKSVLKLVYKFNLEDNIEYTSPHQAVVAKVKSLEPTAKIGVFFSPYPDWMPSTLGDKSVLETMTLLSASVAHLPQKIATKKLVKALREEHFQIHLADCNALEEIRKAFDLQVDQFSTNDISLSLEENNKKP